MKKGPKLSNNSSAHVGVPFISFDDVSTSSNFSITSEDNKIDAATSSTLLSPVYTGEDSAVSTLSKKLFKKDDTTKLKALSDLAAIVRGRDRKFLQDYLPHFSFLFNRIHLDNNRQVRERLLILLLQLIAVEKREFGTYMRSLIGPWWILAADPCIEVKNAAIMAWNAAIPPKKREQVLIFLSIEILKYVNNNLSSRLETLSDMALCSQEEAEERFERVICSSLSAINFLADNCTTEENRASAFESEIQKTVVQYSTDALETPLGTTSKSKTLLDLVWSKCKHKNVNIRLASYSTIRIICKQIQKWIICVPSKALALKVGTLLEERSEFCVNSACETLAALFNLSTTLWGHIDVSTKFVPNLTQMLEAINSRISGDNSPLESLISQSIMLLGNIPPELISLRSFHKIAISNIHAWIIHLIPSIEVISTCCSRKQLLETIHLAILEMALILLLRRSSSSENYLINNSVIELSDATLHSKTQGKKSKTNKTRNINEVPDNSDTEIDFNYSPAAEYTLQSIEDNLFDIVHKKILYLVTYVVNHADLSIENINTLTSYQCSNMLNLKNQFSNQQKNLEAILNPKVKAVYSSLQRIFNQFQRATVQEINFTRSQWSDKLWLPLSSALQPLINSTIQSIFAPNGAVEVDNWSFLQLYANSYVHALNCVCVDIFPKSLLDSLIGNLISALVTTRSSHLQLSTAKDCVLSLASTASAFECLLSAITLVSLSAHNPAFSEEMTKVLTSPWILYALFLIEHYSTLSEDITCKNLLLFQLLKTDVGLVLCFLARNRQVIYFSQFFNFAADMRSLVVFNLIMQYNNDAPELPPEAHSWARATALKLLLDESIYTYSPIPRKVEFCVNALLRKDLTVDDFVHAHTKNVTALYTSLTYRLSLLMHGSKDEENSKLSFENLITTAFLTQPIKTCIQNEDKRRGRLQLDALIPRFELILSWEEAIQAIFPLIQDEEKSRLMLSHFDCLKLDSAVHSMPSSTWIELASQLYSQVLLWAPGLCMSFFEYIGLNDLHSWKIWEAEIFDSFNSLINWQDSDNNCSERALSWSQNDLFVTITFAIGLLTEIFYKEEFKAIFLNQIADDTLFVLINALQFYLTSAEYLQEISSDTELCEEMNIELLRCYRKLRKIMPVLISYASTERIHNFISNIGNKLLAFFSDDSNSDCQISNAIKLESAAYLGMIRATLYPNAIVTGNTNIHECLRKDAKGIQLILNSPTKDSSGDTGNGTVIWYLKCSEVEIEAVKSILISTHRESCSDPFYTISGHPTENVGFMTEIQTERERLLVDSKYLDAITAPRKDSVNNSEGAKSCLVAIRDSNSNYASTSNDAKSVLIEAVCVVLLKLFKRPRFEFQSNIHSELLCNLIQEFLKSYPDVSANFASALRGIVKMLLDESSCCSISQYSNIIFGLILLRSLCTSEVGRGCGLWIIQALKYIKSLLLAIDSTSILVFPCEDRMALYTELNHTLYVMMSVVQSNVLEELVQYVLSTLELTTQNIIGSELDINFKFSLISLHYRLQRFTNASQIETTISKNIQVKAFNLCLNLICEKTEDIGVSPSLRRRCYESKVMAAYCIHFVLLRLQRSDAQSLFAEANICRYTEKLFAIAIDSNCKDDWIRVVIAKVLDLYFSIPSDEGAKVGQVLEKLQALSDSDDSENGDEIENLDALLFETVLSAELASMLPKCCAIQRDTTVGMDQSAKNIDENNTKAKDDPLGLTLLWLLALRRIEGCTACHWGVKIRCASHLKRTETFSKVMNLIIASAGDLSKQKDLITAFQDYEPSQSIEKRASETFYDCGFRLPVEAAQRLSSYALFRSVCFLPSLVRWWWSDHCSREQKLKLSKFIDSSVRRSLGATEVALIEVARQAGKWDPEELTVKGFALSGEVVATFTREDTKIEMKIKLPPEYPLKNVEVECTTKFGTENRWKRWVLQIIQMLSSQDGSIVDAILLWKNNVARELEGVEPCPICYSVLSMKSQKLPNLQCSTCANKFHAECLYTWFKSSGKSKCVLCQQPFFGTN